MLVVVSVAKGDGLSLGAKRVGRKQWQFSFDKKRARSIILKLYEKGKKKPFYTLPCSENYSVSGIFTVVLEFSEEAQIEYIYEVDGKTTLDPYGRQVCGKEVFGKMLTEEEKEMVRTVAVEETKRVGEPLYTPFHETILYGLHVRGFTKDDTSKVRAKGTFKGIEEKIPYLKRLGINAIMLMPCYEFDECMEEDDNDITRFRYAQKEDGEDGKIDYPTVNFWGYTEKANYFAPKSSYAWDTTNPIKEFKHMVQMLHKNGIQLYMEILFSYDCSYTFILDCLHFWVREYAIDGFKINNDVVPGRLVANDAYLARTKFLATTWNVGEMYGRYEELQEKTLAEYNDGFLVDARRFLKSDEGQAEAFLNRFRKNDLQQGVVNYISNVNGFTLMDMVSYDRKHNEDNGENGQDGTEYNYSWNCGWEGPTKKRQVVQLRLKQIKNALVMLLLSQGIPMIMAGDEFGNSQMGNNNAYCQDNEIGWVNWKQKVMNQRILSFSKKIIALRKAHPVFSSPKGLRGIDYIACGCPDISFHGTKPWYPELSHYSRVLGVMLYGKYAPLSKRKSDKSYYIAYNMHWEHHEFKLPILPKERKWRVLQDTDNEKIETNVKEIDSYLVKARSIVVFEEIVD